jgi:hypothetical protein
MTEAIIIERLDSQMDRVRDHSAQIVNRRIIRGIEASVARCLRQGRDAVVRRLAELDREWDIDRVLMAHFAIAGGIACGVGLDKYSHQPLLGRRQRGWLYFIGAQLTFLFMHASVGWSPPAVVWRRLGIRTKSEIAAERSLLFTALEPALTAADGLNGGPLSVPQVAS